MIYVGDIEPTIYVGQENNIEIYNEDELLYPSLENIELYDTTSLKSDYPSASTTHVNVTMYKQMSSRVVGTKQPFIMPFDYVVENIENLTFLGVREISDNYDTNKITVYYDTLNVGDFIPANTPILLIPWSATTFEIHAYNVQIKAPIEGEKHELPSYYDGSALLLYSTIGGCFCTVCGSFYFNKGYGYPWLAINTNGEFILAKESSAINQFRWFISTWPEQSGGTVPTQDASNYVIEEYVSDFAEQYLTFVASENGSFSFTKNIQYSTDNGSTWTTLASGTSTPTIASGSSIMWKGELTPGGLGAFVFSSTGRYEVEGNVMSLLFGDNFIGQTDLTGKQYALATLFSGSTGLTSAENLVLPATTLEGNCYYYMFRDCVNLTTTPVLPSTTLASDCYRGMFQGCTSLTTSPELPATILVNSCYREMFSGCTSLTYITMLADDVSASGCLTYWVKGVPTEIGTFVKKTNTVITIGISGIPTNWTVQNI